MQQNTEKKSFVSEIIASELAWFKLSLLTRGYFSSSANVLTSSPKISHVNKNDFFEHNLLVSYQSI